MRIESLQPNFTSYLECRNEAVLSRTDEFYHTNKPPELYLISSDSVLIGAALIKTPDLWCWPIFHLFLSHFSTNPNWFGTIFFKSFW